MIHFAKMHGLGNDFMVIDAIANPIVLEAQQIIAWADRHTGIGFDQCLLVEKSQDPDIDFYYRIFNANGKEVGQCGNGARCLARFLRHYGLTNKVFITVATQTTVMQLMMNPDESVTVNMGLPCWSPANIPLQVDGIQDHYDLPIQPNSVQRIHALSLGNPHAVTQVEDIRDPLLAQLGEKISHHAWFPEQCNASFMEILSVNHIKLRVYERGCGETRACGSAAAAAAAVGRRFYQMADTIRVTLPGGDLFVTWTDLQNELLLTGPASFVYEGKIPLCVS